MHPAAQVILILCSFGIIALFLVGLYRLLKDTMR